MSIADIGRLLWDRDIIIAGAALLLSLALLVAYLRAVRRSMLSRGAGFEAHRETLQAPQAPSGPPRRPLEIGAPDAPSAKAVRASWRGARRAAAVQVVAGLLYALAVTLTWGWLTQQQASDLKMTWQWVLLFTLFFAWPIVIVVGLVATVTWRGLVLIVLAYGALLAAGMAYMMQGTPITPSMVAGSWWHVNGPATILVLVILARPIRAMGPIVLALTLAAAAGVLGAAHGLGPGMIEWIGELAGTLGLSGKSGGYVTGLVVFGGAGIVAAIAGYFVLRVLGRLYRARWLSDQSIQTDAVWLTFAILQAPAAVPYLGVVAFPLYKVVAWLGHRLLHPGVATDSVAPRLLLLRVFSLGARSSRLFDAFSRLWRHHGSVRMIAGPDLANATVEPYEFLDFLAGRLQRRFIKGAADLDQRLAEAEPRRDPDGRFRVATFYCHDDTWRMVLRRLASETDLVLMDLRGFTRASQGCIYEINELLQSVRLERLLLVVDETTDETFLAEVLQQGWASISLQARNREDPQPRVRLYRLDHTGRRGVGRLVATLAAMHERGPTQQVA